MIKPTEIRYIKKSNIVFISFEDGISENLTVEYLRCFSPSAEVKGHGPGQEVLQTGKENTGINNIEQVGNYAVKIIFDDGHNTGLYSWEYLHDLCVNYKQNWHGAANVQTGQPWVLWRTKYQHTQTNHNHAFTHRCTFEYTHLTWQLSGR